MRIELRHLRYFIAVAEEAHFGRAAERIGIQQPPLSQQIRSLEEALDCVLLERRPKVALTSCGRLLLPLARDVVSRFDGAIKSVRSAAAGESGVVVVAMSPSFMLTSLPASVASFRAAFPEVEVVLHDVQSSSVLDEVTSGSADIGFLRQPSGRLDELVLREVAREEYVCVLPDAHPLAKSTVRWKGLADEPFVMFPRHASPGEYDLLIGSCRTHGFSPRIVQEAQSWLSMVPLVAAGFGVTFVPTSFSTVACPGARFAQIARDPPIGRTFLLRRPDATMAAMRFAEVVERGLPSA